MFADNCIVYLIHCLFYKTSDSLKQSKSPKDSFLSQNKTTKLHKGHILSTAVNMEHKKTLDKSTN